MATLETQRKHIAERVRELRRGRRWTQAELARQLELSQSRLSEIEAGDGSFTAEQLLRVLALFNVGVEAFVETHNDPRQELQNALARFGAKHLVESDRVVPTERSSDLSDVVRDAVIDGSPRLITALAPVLVRNTDALSLKPIYAELERIGYERRLGWVVENTQHALKAITADPISQKQALRARIVFQAFLDYAHALLNRAEPLDALDATIRSEASFKAMQKRASKEAKYWRIATAISVDDFVKALEDAR